jgi:hypothetical protein
MFNCGNLDIFGLVWRDDLREAEWLEVIICSSCSHVYPHP